VLLLTIGNQNRDLFFFIDLILPQGVKGYRQTQMYLSGGGGLIKKKEKKKEKKRLKTYTKCTGKCLSYPYEYLAISWRKNYR
jgi:hypothetical protein